jgi:hypothetical protein
MPPIRFRWIRRAAARRRVPVIVAACVAGAVGVVILAVVIVLRSPGPDGGAARPVTVRMHDGWTDVGTAPDGLERASGQARTAGHGEVADTLTFDADAGRYLDDVMLVVTGKNHSAVLTVRRQDGRFERLDDAVARMADEVREQGVAVTVTRTAVDQVAGWELQYTAAPEGLRSVEYLLETGSGRYSAEVLGASDEVAALVAAIEVR